MALPSTTRPRGAHTTGPARTAIGALLALVLAVTGAVFGALPASAADTASIVGQVYVKAPGGARVAADHAYGYLEQEDDHGNFFPYGWPDGDNYFSAPNGYFNITGLPAGNYKLRIYGYSDADPDGPYQPEFYNDGQNISNGTIISLAAGGKIGRAHV